MIWLGRKDMWALRVGCKSKTASSGLHFTHYTLYTSHNTVCSSNRSWKHWSVQCATPELRTNKPNHTNQMINFIRLPCSTFYWCGACIDAVRASPINPTTELVNEQTSWLASRGSNHGEKNSNLWICQCRQINLDSRWFLMKIVISSFGPGVSNDFHFQYHHKIKQSTKWPIEATPKSKRHALMGKEGYRNVMYSGLFYISTWLSFYFLRLRFKNF